MCEVEPCSPGLAREEVPIDRGPGTLGRLDGLRRLVEAASRNPNGALFGGGALDQFDVSYCQRAWRNCPAHRRE